MTSCPATTTAGAEAAGDLEHLDGHQADDVDQVDQLVDGHPVDELPAGPARPAPHIASPLPLTPAAPGSGLCEALSGADRADSTESRPAAAPPGLVLDVPPALRMRPAPCTGRGGAGLVGRTYLLGGTPVVVTLAYGPGAAVRNVEISYPDGSTTVRPFRGLRRPPS